MAEHFEVAFTADFLSNGKLVFKEIGLELFWKESGNSLLFLAEPESRSLGRSP